MDGMRLTNVFRKVVVGAALALLPAASFAGVFISVGIAPPVLPVYTQPICPGDGYLWNPGYWAYGPEGYYWIPGVWVRPPQVGLLWTPGYWGWGGSAYIFHAGYWGPHVGFYGGVNYGFGYGGVGFGGGRWEGGHFAYNTAVVNVNRTVIHNVYEDRTVINHTTAYSRTSFNGGNGGIQARPSAQEGSFARENHIAPTAEQQNHMQMAHADRSNFASVNGGHPQYAAARTTSEYHATVQQRGGFGQQGGQHTTQQANVHANAAPQEHAQYQQQQHAQAQQQGHAQYQQQQHEQQHAQAQPQEHGQAQPHAEGGHGGGEHGGGGHEPKR
jgi:WXXGXW repeat (2 copies)